MSQIRCECAGQPFAAGLPGRGKLNGEYVFPIFAPYIDSTGSVQKIEKGAVINSAYVLGKFNNENVDDRWNMFPRINNLAAAPTVDDTEDIDGVSKKTGSQTKQPITYSHVGRLAQPFLISAYDSMECDRLGVIWVTRKGDIAGSSDSEGNLEFLEVEGDTLMANYQMALSGSTPKIDVSVVYSELVNEACLDYIDACTIDFNPLNWFAQMVLEVEAVEVSNASQTTIVVDLGYGNSGYGEKKPATGLVKADFSYDGGDTPETVYNTETSASVDLTSVTESVVKPGRYTILMDTAQTATDIIKIDLAVDGYNMQSFYVTLV